MSKLIIEHFHGVALQPKPTDMAFPHRAMGYSVLIIAQWSDPKDNAQNLAWVKETFAALEPFIRQGAYSNSRISTIRVICSATTRTFRLQRKIRGRQRPATITALNGEST